MDHPAVALISALACSGQPWLVATAIWAIFDSHEEPSPCLELPRTRCTPLPNLARCAMRQVRN